MKYLILYAKYIFPLLILGGLLDIFVFKTSFIRYIGIFVGSMIATKKIENIEKDNT